MSLFNVESLTGFFDFILFLFPSLLCLLLVLSRQDIAGKKMVLLLVAMFSLNSAFAGSQIDWESLFSKSDINLRIDKINQHHALPTAVVKDSGWRELVSSYNNALRNLVVEDRDYPDEAIITILERMYEYNAKSAKALNAPDSAAMLRESREKQRIAYAQCIKSDTSFNCGKLRN